MKAKFTLLAVLVAAFLTGFAQQPTNGSFETWSQSINPDGWTSVEDLIGSPSSLLTFKDTAHTDGSFSIRLQTDTITGIGLIPGFVALGPGALINQSPYFYGVPFTYRPDTLIFDYKYTSPGTDTAAIFMSLSKNTAAILGILGQNGIGFALTSSASWHHAAIPLSTFYLNGNTPDTLHILLNCSNSHNPVIGSALNVDNVRFGYATPPIPTITATITAGGATTFCTGDSVTLQANTGNNYTYQWNVGGNVISGATSSSYVAKTTGSYTVTIDSASSTATSNTIIVTDTTCGSVGIKAIAAANLSIYPNPANNLLNINSDINLAGFNLQMFNVVGQLVLAQVLDGNNNSVNITNLANGTYICRITNKENGLISQNKFNVIK